MLGIKVNKTGPFVLLRITRTHDLLSGMLPEFPRPRLFPKAVC